ncbi:MAG TPA: DUF4252 domain-containing protein [Pyrinomonadaceae bacterium]|jgi:hypothetical protein
MKTRNQTFRRLCALALVVCGATAAARAQTRYPAQLQIESLDALAAKANQVVDVNIDERLLRLVPVKLLANAKSEDVDMKQVAQIVAGLKGIYVKDFEFNADGEYTDADLAPLRAQLRGADWVRFVNVVNKSKGRKIEVYMMTAPQGARVEGLAVIAVEPKRLTAVNIVGIIDIEKLSKLEGQFGIPEFGIEEEKAADHKPAQTPAPAAAKKP